MTAAASPTDVVLPWISKRSVFRSRMALNNAPQVICILLGKCAQHLPSYCIGGLDYLDLRVGYNSVLCVSAIEISTQASRSCGYNIAFFEHVSVSWGLLDDSSCLDAGNAEEFDCR